MSRVSINSHRVFGHNNNDVNKEGRYVLYWMQIQRRLEYNYALEYAVGWANKLNKPLLIYEGLSADYPWACDRFHQFILEGMKENWKIAGERDLSYISYVEPEPGAGKGLIYKLAEDACLVITDQYPVYIMKEHNTVVPKKVDIPYISIDSNGMIPLGLTDKDPYSAYHFRKIVQKNFIKSYTHPPKEDPFDDLENHQKIKISQEIVEDYPTPVNVFDDIPAFIKSLPIDHNIPPVNIKGTRKAALRRLDTFISNDLHLYEREHNHPDADKTSGLSPWLHFGKIATHEIVREVLKQQPEGWDLRRITYNKGSTGGFYNGDENISSFLDELITWREVGFHFAYHRDDYDQFESLPDWVLDTLNDHRDDAREYIYSLEEFEQAQTHDQIWNAAQRQLRQEGTIHNYLRMLWGKKVIEWTPDPETALRYLIELNNKYAIDGRDPNSYSGIFWCFGRFDRPWQERKIFGKIRYMTSKSTRNKVRLSNYLREYGE